MDLEDCVFYERKKRAERRYAKIEQQAESLTFPFAALFGDSGGFEDWLDRVLDHRPELDDDRKILKKRLREARDLWIKPVEDYEFPMVTLAETTCPSAVCTIFETLNRTGVKLSVFDLLAARFWPEDVRLRELWEQAQEDHPVIADFEIDPYYVLQAISILTASTAASCKRGDVLKMTVSQITSGWQPVVSGLAEALRLIRDDCGIIIAKWLPYNTIVIPMAAACAVTSGASGPSAGAASEKVKRWFWCSVLGQAYERAPNSQSAKDFVELKRWFDGGEPPETVRRFSFDPDSLTQTTPRQRAVYRAVVALILRQGARDFHTGKKITANMMLDEKIDDHHVFPQGYLTDAMPDVSGTLRDCVLNRTLIDKKTNIRISKRPPSDYLAEIGTAIGDDKLASLLHSHLLPSASSSALTRDAFQAFLKERQALVMKQIENATV